MGGNVSDNLLRRTLVALVDSFMIDGRRVLVSSRRDLVTAKRAVQPPRKVDLRDIEDLLELIGG